MITTLVATPDFGSTWGHIPDVIPITAGSLMEAMGLTVQIVGADHTSTETTATDEGLVTENPHNSIFGLVGLALIHHGVDRRILRTMEDFLVEGDFGCIPSGPFHLINGARALALKAEDLDQLGWQWGDILTELEGQLAMTEEFDESL